MKSSLRPSPEPPEREVVPGAAGGPFADLPDPRQLEIYASWTPEQRWARAVSLRSLAWHLKVCFVHQEHPGWTEAEVLDEVRRNFLHARG